MTDIERDLAFRTSPVVERLPVGRTISATFGTIARGFLPLYGLAAIAALLSLPALYFIAEATQQAKTGLRPGLLQQLGLFYGLQILVTLFLYVVATDGSYRVADGEGFDMGTALKSGLRRYLPALFAALVFYVMILIGFLLLVVPGLIAGAVYGLAPALSIVERLGPFAALSRSAALTRGSRWRCVGVALVLLLLPSTIVTIVAGVASAAAGPTTKVIVQVVLNFVIFPIFYVCPTVMILELKRLHEGGGSRSLVDVF